MAFVPGCDYDVFLSYSHADNSDGWVQALDKALTSRLRQRVAKSVDVFLDPKLAGNKPLDAELRRHIERSAVFVAVVSRSYLDSEWCRKEVEWFRAAIGPADVAGRLFAVRFDDVPPEQFQSALQTASPGYVFHGPTPQGKAVLEFQPASDAFREEVAKLRDEIAKTLEWLKDRGGPGPRTPAERVAAYLAGLAVETSLLTMLGMGKNLQIELPIAETYVPLTTKLARSFEERKADRFAERAAEWEEDVRLNDVFHRAGRLGQRGAIILGEPGAGKTTGARQLAWRLSSGTTPPEELGLPAGIVPVLLKFRNASRSVLEGAGGLRALLDEALSRGGAGGHASSEDLWKNSPDGLLWILDGLDEVVDPARRRKVSEWIRAAVESPERPHDWFVVTCRFQGYFRDGVPLGPKFVEFHVRPLDAEQVDRFVRDWFTAAYAKLLGKGEKTEAEAQRRAQADSEKLAEILRRPAYQTQRMRELATNPLLLTILCIVFHQQRELPRERKELYDHCVEVLLDHWRRERYQEDAPDAPPPYDARKAQAVLARLAWWMHQQQDRTAATLDDLAAEACWELNLAGEQSGLGRDGHAFLQRMREEAGILAMTADGDGRCGFLHLTFQEYLAAEHAAGHGLARELAARLEHSWWTEVALLSLRSHVSYCEAFFRAMLAAGVAENRPDLAARCVEEATQVTPAPFLEELEAACPRSGFASAWRWLNDRLTGRAGSRDTARRAAAVLRLVKERAQGFPGLAPLCERLSRSTDVEVRGYAFEILARLGSPVQVPEALVAVAGQTRVDEKSGLTFVWIPAGEFSMGANDLDEADGPVHRVRITRGFWLGKYPVTNAQYDRYLKAAGGGVAEPEFLRDRRFNQPGQPVVGVTWDEAAAFCQWAGGQLPTEAQWEYACRAGSTTAYCFGDDEARLGEYAWYDENSGGQTQPVGAKLPNAWGLHDMHGNVWEWCEDVWDASAYQARRDVVADPVASPPSLGEGNPVRVVRGGSWDGRAGYCRSAIRNWYWAGYRVRCHGFRVCLVSGPVAVPTSIIQQ